jgi:hypothetical protein
MGGLDSTETIEKKNVGFFEFALLVGFTNVEQLWFKNDHLNCDCEIDGVAE